MFFTEKLRFPLHFTPKSKMKNLSFIVAAFFLITGFYSCKSFEGAAISAKPDPIEVHADSIQYEVKVLVQPGQKLKKGGVYTGEGKIGSNSQRKVVISADKYPNLKKTGLDSTIKVATSYRDDMNGNPLVIKQSYERKGKTFELPDIENVAQCCITTSRMVLQKDQLIWSQHEYQKEVPIHLEAKFQFPKDIWKIQDGDYNKTDIVAIGEFFTKKYPASSITIKGFASPEGPYKRNVMLSVNRSKEVQKWLSEKLSEAGYKNYLDTSFFKIEVTHEDWEGFKSSVNSLPYDADVKSQILEIISAGLSEDEKESSIMALVGGKEKVENILAPLRRATIIMDGSEPRRSDEEIDKISADFIGGSFTGNLKETFEKEEWLYAISRVDDASGKKALLEAFREAHAGDARAFNDLGIIAIMENDKKAAQDLLESADKLKSGDYAISNNLGSAYMKLQKWNKAKDALEASLSANETPEAGFNYGVLLEKRAQYNTAANRFASAASAGLAGANYNLALCKLLQNDLSGAKADLTNAIKEDKEEPMNYYLLSVTGARANDASLMSMNLKKACELDERFKEKARQDLEFRKFWTSAEFKAATR